MIDVADDASALVDGGYRLGGIEGDPDQKPVVNSGKMLFARLRRVEIEQWLVIANKGHHEALEASGVRMFTKVATIFMNAATAEQSCKALNLRLSGTPPRGAAYPTGV